MRSSSFHRLNADHPLSRLARILWYGLNYVNNHFWPNKGIARLDTRKFAPSLGTAEWAAIHPKSSPSRALSDLFWMQLAWSAICTALGEISVADIGCGSGKTGVEFQKYAKGQIKSYVGVDENPRTTWDDLMQEHAFIKLHAGDSTDLLSLIPKSTNMVVSQSAIEHFPEDLTFFRQVRQLLSQEDKPWIQVHLFPAAACLPLYRYHGIRQYTPRTVRKIIELFPGANSILFALGGQASNKVHWDFITEPILIRGASDRRDSETEAYQQAVKQALTIDSTTSNEPSFYALVIENQFPTSCFPAK